MPSGTQTCAVQTLPPKLEPDRPAPELPVQTAHPAPSKPWAQTDLARDAANFGFGFLFLGPLANIGVFAALSTLGRTPIRVHPWWLGPIAICVASGIVWLLQGRRGLR